MISATADPNQHFRPRNEAPAHRHQYPNGRLPTILGHNRGWSVVVSSHHKGPIVEDSGAQPNDSEAQPMNSGAPPMISVAQMPNSKNCVGL